MKYLINTYFFLCNLSCTVSVTAFPHIVSAHLCTVTFGLLYCDLWISEFKKENDLFLADASVSGMTAPHPSVLTVHTPDLVDLIQDPHAQGPVLVHMNAISGYHGQEAGVDHQFTHHEKRF